MKESLTTAWKKLTAITQFAERHPIFVSTTFQDPGKPLICLHSIDSTNSEAPWIGVYREDAAVIFSELGNRREDWRLIAPSDRQLAPLLTRLVDGVLIRMQLCSATDPVLDLLVGETESERVEDIEELQLAAKAAGGCAQ